MTEENKLITERKKKLETIKLTDKAYPNTFRKKDYTDKNGNIRTFIKLTCGVGWGSSFSTIKFIPYSYRFKRLILIFLTDSGISIFSFRHLRRVSRAPCPTLQVG